MKKNQKFVLISISFLLFMVVMPFVTADEEIYIDPEISKALETQEEVRITVNVWDDTGIVVTKEHTEGERKKLINEKKIILSSKTDMVLSTLLGDEFKLEDKFLLGNGFYGDITKEGFDKLIKNPHVSKIYLPGVLYTQPAKVVFDNENETDFNENDSISEKILIEKKQISWFSRLINFLKSLFNF